MIINVEIKEISVCSGLPMSVFCLHLVLKDTNNIVHGIIGFNIQIASNITIRLPCLCTITAEENA